MIIVADSNFGQILYDASGQAIYLFDAEDSDRPQCYGDCAQAAGANQRKPAPHRRSSAQPARHNSTQRRFHADHLRRPPALLPCARGEVPSSMP